MTAIACAISFTLIGYAIRCVLGPIRRPAPSISSLIFKCSACGNQTVPITGEPVESGGSLIIATKLNETICPCTDASILEQMEREMDADDR